MDEREQAITALQEMMERLRERVRFRQAVADIEGRPQTAGEEPSPVILVVDEVSLLRQDPSCQPALEYLQDIARLGRRESVILHATE